MLAPALTAASLLFTGNSQAPETGLFASSFATGQAALRQQAIESAIQRDTSLVPGSDIGLFNFSFSPALRAPEQVSFSTSQKTTSSPVIAPQVAVNFVDASAGFYARLLDDAVLAATTDVSEDTREAQAPRGTFIPSGRLLTNNFITGERTTVVAYSGGIQELRPPSALAVLAAMDTPAENFDVTDVAAAEIPAGVVLNFPTNTAPANSGLAVDSRNVA